MFASISFVRWITHTTFPRHSTLIFWPGSSLLMSTSTGAPAALARSLGQRLMTNGTAAAIAPTAPIAVVAPRRNRRLLLFTLSPVAIGTDRAAKPLIIDDPARLPEESGLKNGPKQGIRWNLREFAKLSASRRCCTAVRVYNEVRRRRTPPQRVLMLPCSGIQDEKNGAPLLA